MYVCVCSTLCHRTTCMLNLRTLLPAVVLSSVLVIMSELHFNSMLKVYALSCTDVCVWPTGSGERVVGGRRRNHLPGGTRLSLTLAQMAVSLQ